LSGTGFDFFRFSKAVENSADGKYRLMALEPIGIIYIASQYPLRSALMGINIPRFPRKKSLNSFFHNFNKPEIEVISHGFGRGLFFQAHSLSSAIKNALANPDFFYAPDSLRGIAFAYTMVNNRHLDKVFITADKLASRNAGNEMVRCFQEGICSALSFLEWHMPGLLESLMETTYTRKAKEMLLSHRSDGGIYRL
jgi:hypothetical protein